MNNVRRLRIDPELLVGLFSGPVTLHTPQGDWFVTCDGMPDAPMVVGSGVDERGTIWLDLSASSFENDEPLIIHSETRYSSPEKGRP